MGASRRALLLPGKTRKPLLSSTLFTLLAAKAQRDMEKKTSPSRHDYPVADSPFWLRIEMYIQKFGTVLLTLLVLAGLGGLFSQGWLSAKTTSSRDQQLTVQYERFSRLMSDDNLQITVSAPTSKRLVLAIGGDFMHDAEIRSLQPQPQKMYSQANELILEYDSATIGKPFIVWLGITPLGVGRSAQHFTLNGRSTVAIAPFIWP